MALAILSLSACSSRYGTTNVERIVGAWKITKPARESPPDTVLEFTRDGKLIWSATMNNQITRIEGTYKVEGNVIIATRDIGGQEDIRKIKIKALTDSSLITELPEGTVDEYERR
jgi:uncharacterized protein (TIGR03066 family)